jgi:hypothetical protein
MTKEIELTPEMFEGVFYSGFAEGVRHMIGLDSINEEIRKNPLDIKLGMKKKDLLKIIEETCKLGKEFEEKMGKITGETK